MINELSTNITITDGGGQQYDQYLPPPEDLRTLMLWNKLNEAIRHIQVLEEKLLNPEEIENIS